MNKRLLLVVDLQPSFADLVFRDKCLDFINSNRDKYDKVVCTIFQNKEDSNFTKMLKWNDCKTLEKDYISGLQDIEVIIKNTYAVDISQFSGYDIDIIGCDTDACIMATAFNCFDAGLSFRIITNYCTSSGGKFRHLEAIKLMKSIFGSAVCEVLTW